MVKIWKVNIRLCNVFTLYLCTLFLVQGGKWTGYVLFVLLFFIIFYYFSCVHVCG